MKITPFLITLAALGFAGVSAGCSSVKPVDAKNPTTSSPETVCITFHVKAGKEAEMKQVLAEAWDIYRHKKLVFAEPHIVVQAKENGGSRLIEIFTWVNHDVPEHVPDSVKAVWNRMQSLCEERDGRLALEGGEVERIVPPLK